MATITLTVLDDGVPVVGASVIVGEITQSPFTTNSDGQITKTVDADFAVCVHIIVKLDGLLIGNMGPVMIEAGDALVFDI